MEKSIIIEKLTEIFRDTFSDEDIVLNNGMTPEDLENWDSLTHKLMIAEIESEFGIKFKLKELNNLQSVGSIIETISNHLQ